MFPITFLEWKLIRTMSANPIQENFNASNTGDTVFMCILYIVLGNFPLLYHIMPRLSFRYHCNTRQCNKYYCLFDLQRTSKKLYLCNNFGFGWNCQRNRINFNKYRASHTIVDGHFQLTPQCPRLLFSCEYQGISLI